MNLFTTNLLNFGDILDILAKIVSTAVQGCTPELMGLGQIAASRKAAKKLKKAVSISNSKQKNIQSKEGESVSTLKIKSRSIW